MAIDSKKAWMIGLALSIITIGGQIVGYSLTAGTAIGELKTTVASTTARVEKVETKQEEVNGKLSKHMEDQARTEERYNALIEQNRDLKIQLARIERKLDAKK